MSVKVDTSEDPVADEMKCAFVSIKEIILDDSGEMPVVCHIQPYQVILIHL